jgi:hypothetical protein
MVAKGQDLIMPRPTNPADVQSSKSKSSSGSGSSSSSLISRPVTIIDPGKSRPSGIGDCVFLESARKQSIGVLFGGPGSGKTSLMLRHAPSPGMLINFDGRARDVVEDARAAGKEIHYLEVPYDVKRIAKMTKEEAQQAGMVALDYMTRTYEAGLEAAIRGKLNYIALDTGSELGNLITLAIRGRVGTKESDFGNSKNQISLQWWGLFQSARSAGVNLVVLSRQTGVWRDNAPVPDRYQPQIQDTAEDAADWICGIKMKNRGKKFTFEIMVHNAKVNPAETLSTYTEEQWGEDGPWAYMNSMLYPKSSIEDWK